MAENQDALEALVSAVNAEDRSGDVSMPSQRDQRDVSQVTQIHHYYDGSTRRRLGEREIARLIADRPRKRHLIWIESEQKWASWRAFPDVVEAVRTLMVPTLATHERPRDQAPDETRSEGEARLKPKQSSGSGADAGAAPKRDLISRGDPFAQIITSVYTPPVEYMSVPETDFTRFTLELTNSRYLNLYVGLAGTIESGGIFIKTTRSFHLGDDVQVTLTICGKTLLNFESTVSWIRLPETGLEQGVGVAWTTLTERQVAIIKRATRGAEYEFYDA